MKDFEFLFPFTDEYYRFHSRVPFKTHEEWEIFSSKQSNFETQLNYVTYRLGFDRDSNNIRINQFITLVLDSLLRMEEYKLVDSSMFKKMMISEYPNLNWRCSINQKQNVEHAISEMKINKDNSLRYFGCAEGLKAYWELKIVRRKTGFHIVPTLQNTDCYFAVYW